MIWLIPLFPDLTFKLYFVEKIFEFAGLCAQILAMIYAQDVFFFNKPYIGSDQCPRADFEATLDWLNVEIVIFYANLVVNVIFILLSEFLLKNTGLMYLEKQNNKSDFLLKYKTMLGIYQTFFMMVYCNCYCI
jgi:hypothetical protein